MFKDFFREKTVADEKQNYLFSKKIEGVVGKNEVQLCFKIVDILRV
jgi:hypothetical protein